MGPIEYDNDQPHREYKSLIDTLMKKGFRRVAIAKRIGVHKSTISRLYKGEDLNPQLCVEYLALIKKEFGAELGVGASETDRPYDSLIQSLEKKIDTLVTEIQLIRESNARIEQALHIGPEKEIKKS